jgi:transcriptional regulator with XRE-family HTH domain
MTKRKSRVDDDDLREHCLKSYPNLKPEKATFYQDRLAHWYKSHRTRNNLTVEAMAEKLGLSVQHYRLLEAVLPNNKVIKAIDLFAEIGALEKIDEYGFMNYLYNPQVAQNETLQPWDSRLIEGFSAIDVGTRRDFTNSLVDPNSDFKQKRLQRLLQFATDLARVGENELASFETLLKSLLENRG